VSFYAINVFRRKVFLTFYELVKLCICSFRKLSSLNLIQERIANVVVRNLKIVLHACCWSVCKISHFSHFAVMSNHDVWIVCQLPIYDEPEPVQFERVPEWETAFHRQVSRARKWTWSYLDSIQVAIEQMLGEKWMPLITQYRLNIKRVKSISQLCFNYDTTTMKNWHVRFLLALNWKQAHEICRSRIAIVITALFGSSSRVLLECIGVYALCIF